MTGFIIDFDASRSGFQVGELSRLGLEGQGTMAGRLGGGQVRLFYLVQWEKETVFLFLIIILLIVGFIIYLELNIYPYGLKGGLNDLEK